MIRKGQIEAYDWLLSLIGIMEDDILGRSKSKKDTDNDE